MSQASRDVEEEKFLISTQDLKGQRGKRRQLCTLSAFCLEEVSYG